YYAEHLQNYYDALAVGASHNYYEGRATAKATPFLAYFCTGMAESFAKIRSRAEEAQRRGEPNQSAALRDLASQERKALSLFAKFKTVASGDMAKFFRIGPRSASALCLR